MFRLNLHAATFQPLQNDVSSCLLKSRGADNVGIPVDANLRFLRQLVEVITRCRERPGMRSRSMTGIAQVVV
jgi:hypothetical protein